MIKEAGLFTFPWDFVDEGVDELIARAGGLGLTHLIVASVYHAGFFLYPHNPRRRTHLVEDGVAYFHPSTTTYVSGPIRPRVASICRDEDWFSVICDRAIAAGLKICAWTVMCHNTRIGLKHPEATIHNAFGDSYPHALSPGHPDTVTYCSGLMNDLASRYPIDVILVEAADYRRRKHGSEWVAGHHHERDGTHLRPLEMALMDLSFNPADVQRAEMKGIDAGSVRRSVVAHLGRYFEMAPDPPADLPKTIEEFESQRPELVDYRECLRESELSLAAELRDVAHRHNVRLMGDPSPAVDIVVAGAYGQLARQVECTTAHTRTSLLTHQQLAVTVRIGFNSPALGSSIASEQEMIRVTQAVARGGADFVGYYVYAEAPSRCVEWIAPALEAVGVGEPGR